MLCLTPQPSRLRWWARIMISQRKAQIMSTLNTQEPTGQTSRKSMPSVKAKIIRSFLARGLPLKLPCYQTGRSTLTLIQCQLPWQTNRHPWLVMDNLNSHIQAINPNLVMVVCRLNRVSVPQTLMQLLHIEIPITLGRIYLVSDIKSSVKASQWQQGQG